ncbi:MAG: radical SAM protein [Clostridia bacterium]|nr:radical SAM protein [Clostridia bacterium]
MFCFEKNRILLQFHLTGRCNLRCKHCYRTEGDTEPLTTEDIKNVIDQFLDLKKAYNARHSIKKKAHINITGGEPFFRSDIKEILSYIGSKSDELSYGVLSNGSFIDEDMMKLLKATYVSFVQLSIDGDRVTHDELRAKGDYDRVFDMAERLEKNGIRTYISFTANKKNYKHLPKVARECRKRGITKLWSDRLVPIGNGEELRELIIDKDELESYIKVMKKAKGNILVRKLYKTEVTMNRALQFINSDGCLYHCSAGQSLITVDEFGRIMPCRRMPIICGNVFDSTLEEVYYNDPVFKELRRTDIPRECRGCEYAILCRGGARCQSYALTGDYKNADPGCPFAFG